MFEKMLLLLKNIEDDNLNLLTVTGNDRQSRTAQNFFNKNRQFDVSSVPLHQYIQPTSIKQKAGMNDIIDFKMIERN